MRVAESSISRVPGDLDNRIHSRTTQAVHHLSPGWIDTYEHNTPGQIVDITDLPDGLYALHSTVDPDDQLREMDESNNAGTVYFDLRASDLQMRDNPSPPLICSSTGPVLFGVAPEHRIDVRCLRGNWQF